MKYLVIAYDEIPEDKLVLCRNGETICITSVGDPIIKKVEFDTIYMNTADYDRMKALLDEGG